MLRSDHYVRIANVRTLNEVRFSLSGLRVFGLGSGSGARVQGEQVSRPAKVPASAPAADSVDGRVALMRTKPRGTFP